MKLEEAFLTRLRAAQAHWAHESLRRPSSKDEFEYGYRCGYLAGLEKSEAILQDVLKDDKEKDL